MFNKKTDSENFSPVETSTFFFPTEETLLTKMKGFIFFFSETKLVGKHNSA